MLRLWILILFILFLVRCTPTSEPEVSLADNQIKTSELAVLMRQIHQEAKAARKKVLANDSTLNIAPEVYTSLTTATPTDPEVDSPVFDRYAAAYQNALDELLAARPGLQQEAYNNLILNCVACHETFCPGPIPTIKKLEVKAKLQASGN